MVYDPSEAKEAFRTKRETREGKNSIVLSFRLTLEARPVIRAKKPRSPRFAQSRLYFIALF